MPRAAAVSTSAMMPARRKSRLDRAAW